MPSELTKGDVIRVPFEVDPRLGITKAVQNSLVEPDRTRVRRLPKLPDAGDELTVMGCMYVTSHGGSIRTFAGNLAHETGWYPSWRRKRVQYWEGSAQRAFLIRCEVDPEVEWAQSEARRFEFPLAGRLRRYTCDIEVQKLDGSKEFVEIKRNEGDLKDEEYRLTLSRVAEICRRCGWTFRIMFTNEIFKSRQHRANVELFQSRRFARVGPEHVRRLENYSLKHGSDTTYGELASVLEPRFAAAGTAVIQALLVRRRVEIDLTQFLHDRTPVKIL